MIKIITDSSSDLPEEYAKKYGIEVVPLSVIFNGVSYKDGIDITKEEFYKKLEKSEELPSTSQVNPADFEEIFRKYINQGDSILGIFLSSKLSGTYQSAVIAANIIGGDIHLVDSQTATLGISILILEAVKMRNERKSIEEIEERLNLLAEKIRLIALVPTLKYLQKGGRISNSMAIMGGILNICPIIELKNGVLSNIGKIRGCKGFPKFLEGYLKENPIDENYYMALGHTECEEKINEVRNIFLNDKKYITGEIGAIVGTHAGPGAIGMVYITK